MTFDDCDSITATLDFAGDSQQGFISLIIKS